MGKCERYGKWRRIRKQSGKQSMKITSMGFVLKLGDLDKKLEKAKAPASSADMFIFEFSVSIIFSFQN